MDISEYIITFSRWLHIIGASIWLGGTAVYSLIQNPIKKTIPYYKKLFKEINVVKNAFGSSVVSKYVKLKNRELKEYGKQPEDQKSEWSRNNAIDC